MSRPALPSLQLLKATHELHVPWRSYWRHYASGKIYVAFGVLLDEADYTPRVSYLPLEMHDEFTYSGLFSRPYSEWLEEVEWHDREIMRKSQRFTRVVRIDKKDEWHDV
jgi:hypothetical protein